MAWKMEIFESLFPKSIRKNQSILPKQEHRLACDPEGNAIYLVGGENGEYLAKNEQLESYRNFVREVWKFNLSTRVWTELKSENAPVAPQAMSYVGPDPITGHRKLLAYGSRFGSGADIFVYDLNDERWSILTTSGPGPVPDVWEEDRIWYESLHPVMMKKAHYVYIVTCHGFHGPIEVHRLNLHNLIWEPLMIGHQPGSPVAREPYQIAIDDDHRIFIFGGIGMDNAAADGNRYIDFENIPYFDTQSKRWCNLHTVPDLENGFPMPRMNFACVIYKNCVYILAGTGTTSTFFDSLADFWRLHLPTGQWRKLTDFPYPITNHEATVDDDGVMYIYGGYIKENVDNAVFSDRVWKRRLDMQSLKRLAWDGVLKYTSHKLAEMSEQEIQDKLSLPDEFMKKIRF